MEVRLGATLGFIPSILLSCLIKSIHHTCPRHHSSAGLSISHIRNRYLQLPLND